MTADATWLEQWIDGVAAAAFAAATVFAVAKFAPHLGILAVGTALLAFGCCWVLLQRVPRQHRLPLARFELIHFVAETDRDESDQLDELLLTDEQIVVHAPDPSRSDELLLNDVLDAIAPDSRVVRLFAPDQMPTAGQLKAIIDRHLEAQRALPPIADASQALSDALAELRRSLR